jgi:hypothetical protein
MGMPWTSARMLTSEKGVRTALAQEYTYEGESKIIRNVATYCAVGYTAGWAWFDTCGLLVSYCCGADVTLIVDLCHEFCVINLDGPLFIRTKEEQRAVILFYGLKVY